MTQPAPHLGPVHGASLTGASAQNDSVGDAHLGDVGLDDALGRLDELADRPVSEHAEVFDDIHARLRNALEDAAADEQPP